MTTPGGPPIPDSALSRRNPVVKLALLGAISMLSLFILDPVTPAMLYILAAVGVRFGARIPARVFCRAHLPFLTFSAGILLVNAVSRPGNILWQNGYVRVTQQGLTVGASLALRVLLIGVLSIGFLASTDPARLMTSAQAQLRISPRFTYALLAGHRVLQQLPAEWAQLRHAHRVRAPSTRRTGRPRRSARIWMHCAFGLLVSTIRRGERLAQALEGRGLGLNPRTCWRPERLRKGDAVLVLLVVAVASLVIISSASLGALTGFSALFD